MFVDLRGDMKTECLFETRRQGDIGLDFTNGNGDSGGVSACKKKNQSQNNVQDIYDSN